VSRVVRFEVLGFERAEEEAAQLPEPAWLTVTGSPRHGPERTIALALRLAALGHTVTPHLTARMVRDAAHLDALLAAMARGPITDVFVIGGDASLPQGEYSSAGELLGMVRERASGIRTIGIAGYPEGHPAIDSATLVRALEEKSKVADYITTQMCFDPEAVRRWVTRQRERGITLPILIGMAGKVSRGRLLELSVRIGVGPSLAFLRKQRGLRSLIARSSTADRLYDALAPTLDDPRLNIAGFHFFTFNRRIDTWQWQLGKQDRAGRPKESAASTYVNPEESTA